MVAVLAVAVKMEQVEAHGGAGGLRTSSPEGPGAHQDLPTNLRLVAPGSPAKLTLTVGAGGNGYNTNTGNGNDGSASLISHPDSPNNKIGNGGGGGGYGHPGPILVDLVDLVVEEIQSLVMVQVQQIHLLE